MKIKISKLNLLIFLLYESILVILILLTKECLDDKNYRLFIELSSLERITYNPITTIYFILNNLFTNTYAALSFLSIFIGSLYNLSIFLFTQKIRTDFYKLSFLYLIPTFFTPVLVHFFACTIKQGLSTILLSSALLIYYSIDYKSKNKYNRYLIIIVLVLSSIVIHWSATLLLLFWGFTFLILKLLIFSKNLIYDPFSYKKIIIKVKTRFRTSYLFLYLLIFLMIPFIILSIFYDQQLEIQTKFIRYFIGELSNHENYGTRYPLLSLVPSFFVFLKLGKSNDFTLKTLSFSSLLSGIIGYLFIKGPFVRIVISCSFFGFLALGISMIKDKRTWKSDFILFSILNTPSIIYTFINLKI